MSLQWCLVALVVGACASTSSTDPAAAPAPISGTVQDGELALAMGDPARAVAILGQIESDDPMAAYAQELLRDARGELDAVVAQVLADADRLIERDMLSAATERLTYLEELAVVDRGHRRELAARRETIAQRRTAAIERLRATDRLAKEYLLQNELVRALDLLRDSWPAAEELAPELARAWLGLVATAEVRHKAETEAAPGERSSRSRRRSPGRPTTVTPPPAEPPPPSPQELARAEQLKQAAATRERGAYFDAIVAYRQILAEDPSNGAAKNGLKELEPRRQELVKSLLDKANRYFLRQDLAAAAPYYRRVLQIDPDNERAKEGLRMHENLERIRQEAKDK